MPLNGFMSKVRYWDNLAAKWILRHFYFIFFQIALFIIFFFWFVNMFNVIDSSFQTPKTTLMERLLAAQSINITIIALLILLNSFWVLYIFSSIQRASGFLKDITYHLSRIRRKNQ